MTLMGAEFQVIEWTNRHADLEGFSNDFTNQTEWLPLILGHKASF